MIDAPLDKGTVRIGNASFERESIDQDRPVLLLVQSEGANDLDGAGRVSVSVLRARKIALEIAGRSLSADDLSSNSVHPGELLCGIWSRGVDEGHPENALLCQVVDVGIVLLNRTHDGGFVGHLPVTRMK